MLFIVVLVFGVCSGVEIIRRIMIFSDPKIGEGFHYDWIINHFSDVFYVFNSAINFVIYYFWGKEFRKAFLRTFRYWRRGDDESKGLSSTDGNIESGTINAEKVYFVFVYFCFGVANESSC